MKTKKIALVFPETRYPAGQPPLGVGYLASMLRSECPGVEVAILDASFEKHPLESLLRSLKEGRYDIVGISLVTPHLAGARQLAIASKQVNPDTLVIVGGPHATMLPQETLEIPGVDIVCAGEGEIALTRLVQADGNPTDIAGLLYKDMSGSIVVNPRETPVSDLDSLPPPARDLYQIETYINHWYSMDTVRFGLRGTSIMATRGCPYSCTFCQPTISTMFGTKIRKRSPEGIIDELLSMKEQFKLNAFMFEDSTFVMDHEWVRRICKLLIERHVDMEWCCNVRADLATYDLLADMKEAGLRKVNMGVESGSNRILSEIYDKRITVDQVKACLADCKKLGLKVQGYFMLGAPGETREEMEKTLKLAIREPFDDAVFDITTPFPGTRLFDMTQEQIVAPYEEFDCFQRTVYDRAGELSPKEIASLKKRAYWRFYLNPRRILHTISMVIGPKGFTRSLIKARRV